LPKRERTVISAIIDFYQRTYENFIDYDIEILIRTFIALVGDNNTYQGSYVVEGNAQRIYEEFINDPEKREQIYDFLFQFAIDEEGNINPRTKDILEKLPSFLHIEQNLFNINFRKYFSNSQSEKNNFHKDSSNNSYGNSSKKSLFDYIKE
jgi:hypothetical protein